MPSLEFLTEVGSDDALPVEAQGGGGVDSLAIRTLEEDRMPLRVVSSAGLVTCHSPGRPQMVRNGAPASLLGLLADLDEPLADFAWSAALEGRVNLNIPRAAGLSGLCARYGRAISRTTEGRRRNEAGLDADSIIEHFLKRCLTLGHPCCHNCLGKLSSLNDLLSRRLQCRCVGEVHKCVSCLLTRLLVA